MAQPAHSNARPAADTGDWHLSQDDFSVKVAHTGDRRFWIRIDTSRDHPLTITDMIRSAQPPLAVAVALRLASEVCLGAARPDTLHLKDIAPAGDRSAAEAEAAQLALCLVPYADGYGARIADIAIVPRERKFDLVARLEDKPAP